MRERGYLSETSQRNPSSRFGRYPVIAFTVQEMHVGTLLNFISQVFSCVFDFESKERKFSNLEPLKLG